MNSNVIEINFEDINNPLATADNEEVVDYVLEEDEDEMEELPINLESCLLLNTVYIESIDEMKQFLISKKRENESRQTELKNNSNLNVVRDVTISNNCYTHPNSLIPFMAPYFKDIRGLTAPSNLDTIEKRANDEINPSYVCPNKPWNLNDQKKLREILYTDATHRLHKPLRDEKELLTRDKKNLVANSKRITELSAQIRELKSTDPFDLPVPDRWDPTLDWLMFATELNTDHNADECELYWNNFLHPVVNKRVWTKEEDIRLQQLVETYGTHDWDTVARELGTDRLAWQCCSRYQSELNRDIKRVGPLTKAEAQLVEKVIEQCRVGDFIPWHQVKYFIEGRTLAQIKHYWNKINVPKRGDLWSEDENKQLLLAVKKYGTHNWRKVAQFLPGRSNRQCRERYMMRLNFGSDRKLGDWTAQEDRQILDLAPKYDFHWVKLENQMKGRNARQIASRYELLMKYKSIGKDVWKTKTKFGEKNCFVTRTLTVKNKIYEKIRQLINRDKSVDLDRQLRIGRQKLAQKLEHELQGFTVPTNKGRPKKSTNEENIDTKIVELFASFDVKSAPKKIISRSAQDQCVYETTENVFNELLTGKPFESDTELAKAIRLVVDKSITSCKKSGPIVDCSQPSTSSALPVMEPTVTPNLPPNRTTVKGLRGLLIQADYFSQIIAKSKISLDELSNAIKDDQNYAKLFGQFRSLFYWPALLSMAEPPEREPQETEEPLVTIKGPKSKHKKSWLKTDSSRMIEIRTHQTKLIHTEMERNAKIKSEPEVNDEPLNAQSEGAPWYLTQKDRKYYNLKSLDKDSFVFTRIKPKYDGIPKVNRPVNRLEADKPEVNTVNRPATKRSARIMSTIVEKVEDDVPNETISADGINCDGKAPKKRKYRKRNWEAIQETNTKKTRSQWRSSARMSFPQT